jgi:hypothetical protein
MATAETTPIAAQTATIPAAPPRNKGGRPRKYPAPAAPATTAKPGDDDQDLWIWLSTFDSTWWEQSIAYLWRCEPLTDRRNGGKPTHVEKYARSFDIDTIMKAHGSGRYRLDVCRIDASGKGSTRIRQSYFTILNMDYPPKVPYGDWLNDPGNEAWKWAGPKLHAQQQPDTQPGAAHPQAAAAASAMDPSHLIDAVFRGVEMYRGEKDDNQELANQIVDLVKDNQEKMAALMDPRSQLATMKDLLALVAPKADGSSDKLFDFLREELRETRKEMTRLREAQAKPTSILEQIRELGPAIKEFQTMFGGGGSKSSGTDWGGVIEGVFDKIGPYLPAIVDSMTRPAPTPRPAATAQTTIAAEPAAAAFPSATAPHGATPAPAPAASSAPVVDLPPGVSADQVKAEEVKLQAIVSKFGKPFAESAPILVDYVKNQMTGFDFRDWFISRKGMETWTALKQEAEGQGARLVAITQMHPWLKSQLQPSAELLKFMNEFFTNIGEENAQMPPDEDDEDDEETPIAATGRTN